MAPRALSEEEIREFRTNGAVKLAGLLDDHWLDQCREKFNWARAHPSPDAHNGFGSKNFFNDLTSLGSTPFSAASLETFLPLALEGPFAAAAAQLFAGSGDSEQQQQPVWYYDRELFVKGAEDRNEKGELGRSMTPFHQDSSYYGSQGPQFVAFWIHLEDFDLPKSNCLKVVKRSHLEHPMYDHPVFAADDDTRCMFRDKGSYVLPRIPDILALEKQGAVEMCAWDIKKGDVIAFHPHCLHGGAGAAAGEQILTPNGVERRTLVLRFFGDEMFYKMLPMNPRFGPQQFWMDQVKDGEPFWHAGQGQFFKQVRGPPVSYDGAKL